MIVAIVNQWPPPGGRGGGGFQLGMGAPRSLVTKLTTKNANTQTHTYVYT